MNPQPPNTDKPAVQPGTTAPVVINTAELAPMVDKILDSVPLKTIFAETFKVVRKAKGKDLFNFRHLIKTVVVNTIEIEVKAGRMELPPALSNNPKALSDGK